MSIPFYRMTVSKTFNRKIQMYPRRVGLIAWSIEVTEFQDLIWPGQFAYRRQLGKRSSVLWRSTTDSKMEVTIVCIRIVNRGQDIKPPTRHQLSRSAGAGAARASLRVPPLRVIDPDSHRRELLPQLPCTIAYYLLRWRGDSLKGNTLSAILSSY